MDKRLDNSTLQNVKGVGGISTNACTIYACEKFYKITVTIPIALSKVVVYLTFDPSEVIVSRLCMHVCVRERKRERYYDKI